MAKTPEEIKAKKIAVLQKKILTKQTSLGKNEAKKSVLQGKQEAYVAELVNATDVKKIASLNKKNDVAIIKLIRYNVVISEIQTAIGALQSTLSGLLGPF